MAQFVTTASKKEVSQKTHIAKEKSMIVESAKSQDDEKWDLAKQTCFEERYAELERKLKHEAEIAAAAQKPKMTESSTMLEQAEGGVVAEVAAAHHLNEDANAVAAEMEQAEGRFVAEAAATRNLRDDANATAAYNLGEDANAAATKEKQTKQEICRGRKTTKLKKTNEGDDEIRRLIEERRNTAKGDRHQLRGLSKRIKTCIRNRKRTKRQEKIQRIL